MAPGPVRAGSGTALPNTRGNACETGGSGTGLLVDGIGSGRSLEMMDGEAFPSFVLFPDFSRLTFAFRVGGDEDIVDEGVDDDGVAFGGEEDNPAELDAGSSFLRFVARGGVALGGTSALITSVTEAIFPKCLSNQHGQPLLSRMMRLFRQPQPPLNLLPIKERGHRFPPFESEFYHYSFR